MLYEVITKSIALENEEGTATIGVMEAGEYEFGTATIELMTITSGSLEVLLPGEAERTHFVSHTLYEVIRTHHCGTDLAKANTMSPTRSC